MREGRVGRSRNPLHSRASAALMPRLLFFVGSFAALYIIILCCLNKRCQRLSGRSFNSSNLLQRFFAQQSKNSTNELVLRWHIHYCFTLSSIWRCPIFSNKEDLGKQHFLYRTTDSEWWGSFFLAPFHARDTCSMSQPNSFLETNEFWRSSLIIAITQ